MTDTKKKFRLSDQVIGQLRELLQLAMLSNTNFVDHCRALELEESDQRSGMMILSTGYVEGWNKMAERMAEEAQAKADEMAKVAHQPSAPSAEPEPEDQEETIVEISRDPKTGKLVGKRMQN